MTHTCILCSDYYRLLLEVEFLLFTFCMEKFGCCVQSVISMLCLCKTIKTTLLLGFCARLLFVGRGKYII